MSKSNPAPKDAILARKGLILSEKMGDHIIGIPGEDHEAYDKYVDDLLDDFDTMRAAVEMLVDRQMGWPRVPFSALPVKVDLDD